MGVNLSLCEYGALAECAADGLFVTVGETSLVAQLVNVADESGEFENLCDLCGGVVERVGEVSDVEGVPGRVRKAEEEFVDACEIGEVCAEFVFDAVMRSRFCGNGGVTRGCGSSGCGGLCIRRSDGEYGFHGVQVFHCGDAERQVIDLDVGGCCSVADETFGRRAVVCGFESRTSGHRSNLTVGVVEFG